jgi:hypothetical protein
MSFFFKFSKRLGVFFHKSAVFGFSVAFWDFLDSQKDRIGVLPDRIHERKHAAVVDWLTVNFQYFISGFKKQIGENNPLPEPTAPIIWICWWDGVDTMPPVVRACYNSVVRHADHYRVTLVTKYNFAEFTAIPGYIMKKFEAGMITKTHLSDIIRVSLLYGHGGLWLDATILVTNTIPPEDGLFFTVKRDFGGKDVPKRRWTSHLIGGQKENILFKFTRDFFGEYWKKYDELLDYFLMDYVIMAAYSSIPAIKEMVDNTGKNNPYLSRLRSDLENEFDAGFFETITKDTRFHKLTWKNQYPARTADNKLTFYGYILEKYGV